MEMKLHLKHVHVNRQRTNLKILKKREIDKK